MKVETNANEVSLPRMMYVGIYNKIGIYYWGDVDKEKTPFLKFSQIIPSPPNVINSTY